MNILQLPNDIHKRLFDFFTNVEYHTLTFCCKQFHAVAHRHCFGSKFLLASSEISCMGYLDVLQWALETLQLSMNEMTCTRAAQGKHWDVFIWAVDNGCPWNRNHCIGIAKYQRNNKLVDWMGTRNKIPTEPKFLHPSELASTSTPPSSSPPASPSPTPTAPSFKPVTTPQQNELQMMLFGTAHEGEEEEEEEGEEEEGEKGSEEVGGHTKVRKRKREVYKKQKQSKRERSDFENKKDDIYFGSDDE
jgi:hypothetical protein